jgi:hypothetical protein
MGALGKAIAAGYAVIAIAFGAARRSGLPLNAMA